MKIIFFFIFFYFFNKFSIILINYLLPVFGRPKWNRIRNRNTAKTNIDLTWLECWFLSAGLQLSLLLQRLPLLVHPHTLSEHTLGFSLILICFKDYILQPKWTFFNITILLQVNQCPAIKKNKGESSIGAVNLKRNGRLMKKHKFLIFFNSKKIWY